MGKTSGSNFGIYRDRDSRRRQHDTRPTVVTETAGSGSKVLLILSCTAGILLIVSLLALSVVVGKGKPTDLKKMGFKEFSFRDQGGIVTVSKQNASSRGLSVNSDEPFFVPKDGENTDYKSVTRTSRAMDSSREIDNHLYRAHVASGGRSTRFYFPAWPSSVTSTMTNAHNVEPNPMKPDTDYGDTGLVMSSNDYAPIPGLPQYGDQFAQLETYKNHNHGLRPHSIKSIVDYVMTDSMGAHQLPGVKIMGVYVKAPIELDGQSSLSPVNGHAYTPDPFQFYKPAHPSEINHLATSASEQDNTYRFSSTSPAKPTRFPTNSLKDMTNAVFLPYDTVAINAAAQTTPTPPPSNSHSPNKRPLKIMLDIYPVQQTDSNEQEHSTQNKRPSGYNNAPVTSSTSQSPGGGGGRMIVHLNLFPKKNKKKLPLPTTFSPPTSSEPILTLVPRRGSYTRDFHDRKHVYSAIRRKNNSSRHWHIHHHETDLPTWSVTTPDTETESIKRRPSPTVDNNPLSTAINEDLGGILPRNAFEDYDVDASASVTGEPVSNNSTDLIPPPPAPSSPMVFKDDDTDTTTFVDDDLRRDLYNLQATASSVDSSAADFELSSYETSVDTPVRA